MKIQDILTENYNMYTVYKAYGPTDPQVYYGYAQGTEEDVARTWMAGVNRTDPDRAEKRLVAINGGDPDDIKFEVVDVFADELDAWVMRNDLRIQDSQSLTGPTMFPPEVLKRAQKERPEKVEGWKKARGMKDARTAYEATKMGRWPADILKTLASKMNKKDHAGLRKDFDNLAPDAFATKYGI